MVHHHDSSPGLHAWLCSPSKNQLFWEEGGGGDIELLLLMVLRIGTSQKSTGLNTSSSRACESGARSARNRDLGHVLQHSRYSKLYPFFLANMVSEFDGGLLLTQKMVGKKIKIKKWVSFFFSHDAPCLYI